MKLKSTFLVVLIGMLVFSVTACADSARDDHGTQKIDKKVSVTIDADSSNVVHIIIRENGKTKRLTLNTHDLKGLQELEEELRELPDSDLMQHFNLQLDDRRWNHAFLGVTVQKLTPQLHKFFKTDGDNGVLVARVVDDSPAAQAGIKAGDVITSVDDAEIEDPSDLTAVIGNHEPDDHVTVHIVREGKPLKLDATLTETRMGGKHGINVFSYRDPDKNAPPFLFRSESDLQQQMDDLKQQLDDLRSQLDKLKER